MSETNDQLEKHKRIYKEQQQNGCNRFFNAVGTFFTRPGHSCSQHCVCAEKVAQDMVSSAKTIVDVTQKQD